jgi:hypothetical protein
VASRAEQVRRGTARSTSRGDDAASPLRADASVAAIVLPSDTRLWLLFCGRRGAELLDDAEVDAMIRDARGAEPIYVESTKPRPARPLATREARA